MKARFLTGLFLLAALALGGCAWLKDEFLFTLSSAPRVQELAAPSPNETP